MKKTLNNFGISLSVILSVCLFVVLTATPIVRMVSTGLQPGTIKKIIERIDFVELVLSNEDLRRELAEHGIDAEFLDEIKESEIINVGVNTYIESLFEGKLFDKETVLQIIEQGQDEAVYYIKGLSKRLDTELHQLPDDEVKQVILQSVEEKWQSLSEALPTPEDLGITQQEYDAMSLMSDFRGGASVSPGQLLKIFYDGQLLMLFIIAAAILSLLIWLLRIPKFKGFIWLFVVYLAAALPTFGVGALIGAIDVSAIPQLGQIQDELVAPVIAVMSGCLMGSGGVILGLAALWIAAYIALRIAKKIRVRNNATSEMPDVYTDENEDFASENKEGCDGGEDILLMADRILAEENQPNGTAEFEN